jgi:hypothetical protein
MLSFSEYNAAQSVTYEEYVACLDGELVERVTISRTLQDLKNHFSSILGNFKISYEEISNAMKDRSVFALLKAFGFSVKNMAAAMYKSVTTLNQILMSVVVQMSETGDLEKLKNGSMTVDQFLGKYPALKRITGPMVSGFLVYQWLNMSFSGDFKQDFNIETILESLRGNYTFEDVLASPLGFKSMIQLMSGLAIGVTFPWGVILPANIMFALVYTVALKTKNKRLQVKARKAMRKHTPKGGSASTTRYI